MNERAQQRTHIPSDEIPRDKTPPDEDELSRRGAQRELAKADPDAGTIAAVILAVLAVFYTLYLTAELVLPLLFAVVLNLLLAPAKRLLTDRLRLPAALAALVLLLALFMLVSGLTALVSVPASNWIAKAPQGLPQLQQRLGFLAAPIDFFRHGVDQVQHLMQQEPPAGQQTVAVQQSSNFGGVGMSILQGTRAALGQLLTLAVVLFFLLASGDSLLRRLVEILPSFGDKRRVIEMAMQIERNVSGYLLTITAMNALVGIANGVSMWAQGIPDALLWGTLAFLLNYIPILGPFTGIVIFFFVGLFSSPTLWQAALPPAVYLIIHVVEGESVTPMLLARRFTLNPVLVIVSLFFWDFLWGVPGAFLAVPLLAITKIIADRVPVLTPLGHLLGGPSHGKE
jgi:predicted PurR-regulated permease PerM